MWTINGNGWEGSGIPYVIRHTPHHPSHQVVLALKQQWRPLEIALFLEIPIYNFNTSHMLHGGRIFSIDTWLIL